MPMLYHFGASKKIKILTSGSNFLTGSSKFTCFLTLFSYKHEFLVLFKHKKYLTALNQPVNLLKNDSGESLQAIRRADGLQLMRQEGQLRPAAFSNFLEDYQQVCVSANRGSKWNSRL